MPECEDVLTTEDEADRLRGSAKAVLGRASRRVQSGQKAGRGERSRRSRLVAYVYGARGQGITAS